MTKEYKLEIAPDRPRPFFAELPYYVWGRVNYDSDGDCATPLDRTWTCMELEHRDTDEELSVSSEGTEWIVMGPDPAAARLAYFLQIRCNARSIGPAPDERLGEWDHAAALARADRVAREFDNPVLAPFAVDHGFWGSWKWIGWFGTHFTWVGRWILDAVVRNDPRAVDLCVDWLREGPFSATQSAALRYALGRFTGESFDSDAEWIRWYDELGGKERFPEPDMNAWYEELKAIHGA
jgi:hypothetical protein